MAHTARLNELTERLVSSITGQSKEDATFKSLTDHAARGLRDQSHARTNPFEIKNRFSGLVEKFTVRNRDDLADALQARLDELPTKSRWLPETLSLLLQLSDRPVEQTNLEDLEGLTKLANPPAELTWEETLADDPFDEDGIWNDIERGYHSSGDDATVDDGSGSEPTASTDATSVAEEDLVALARSYIVPIDQSKLDEVRKVRDNGLFTSADGKTQFGSELMLVRETFAMLHAVPTTAFDLNSETGQVAAKMSLALETTAASTFHDLRVQLADMGSRLNRLRRWTEREQKAAYMQSAQASTQTLLRAFAHELGELEQRYVRPLKDTVVSIIDIRTQVERLARPLLLLSDIVHRAHDERITVKSPFSQLDALYDEACITQMSGDDAAFAAVTDVLLATTQTYLRSIKAWIEMGTLPETSGEDFFVVEANADCEPGKVWQDRWTLHTLANGQPYAPNFLQAFVGRVFAMGKARAFLQVLDPAFDISAAPTDANPVAFEDLTKQLHDSPLLPFSQLFGDALSVWLRSSSTNCTGLVRSELLHGLDDGLVTTFRNLGYVFFGKDGTLFQTFADTIFARIRRHPTAWKDRFMLTELAQSTLGASTGVVINNIAVSVKETKSSIAGPTIRELEDIHLRYLLPWPLQNVTRSHDLPAHSGAFTLLLQTYYAEYLLRPEFFTLRTLDSRSSAQPSKLQTAMKLRWQLTCFGDALHHHIATTASTLHAAMLAEMIAADGIDSMGAIWAEYERRLPVSLLLAPNLSPIKDAILDILELCGRFVHIWKQLFPASVPAGSQSSSASFPVSQHHGADLPPLLVEFERGISFITAGLRSVSRASGETTLEAFAERLEWQGG